MVAKGRRESTGEVGEIDTSAPFQSVKDAVNLFGESAFSPEKPIIRKPNPQSAEKVLVKQTELHLTQKKLNKLKEQLENAETIREQALTDLEHAKRTVDELTRKLKAVNESKESASKVTEAAKSKVKQIEEAKPGTVSVSSDAQNQDIEQYGIICKELDAAKQELRKIRQVSNESLETKTAALIKVEEVKHVAQVNSEKIELLRKEIAAVNESIEQTKVSCSRAQKEQSEIYAEKEIQQLSYKAGIEESGKKLMDLKKEFDPDFVKKLELQLNETYDEISLLQKEMENAKALDLDSVNVVNMELDDAKGLLKKLVEEKNSLQELAESLKVELKNVKMDHGEVKAKEAETESMAGELHLKLSKSMSELEICVAEEVKVKEALEDMMLTINQITSETESAKREAKEMRKKAEELMKEAEVANLAVEDTELNLRVALDEVEEAKAAEAKALELMKSMSEKLYIGRTSMAVSGTEIRLSQEEFESLNKKPEVVNKLAEMKVAAAMAQVEAVRASENQTLRKLETTKEEIEKVKGETKDALKKAAMAEAAKKAVEGELKRWRERDEKKAAEAASRIVSEAEMSTESSPLHYKAPKQKLAEFHKLEKTRTSVVSKKVLLPNLSGLFNRKKGQVEWGATSHLPSGRSI